MATKIEATAVIEVSVCLSVADTFRLAAALKKGEQVSLCVKVLREPQARIPDFDMTKGFV